MEHLFKKGDKCVLRVPESERREFGHYHGAQVTFVEELVKFYEVVTRDGTKLHVVKEIVHLLPKENDDCLFLLLKGSI